MAGGTYNNKQYQTVGAPYRGADGQWFQKIQYSGSSNAYDEMPVAAPAGAQESQPAANQAAGQAAGTVGSVGTAVAGGSAALAQNTKKTVKPGVQVVPGQASTGQMNIVDYAGTVAADPTKGMRKDDPKTTKTNESMFLSDHIDPIKVNKNELINAASSKYKMKPTGIQADTATVDQTAQANQVQPQQAQGYEAQTTQQNVAQNAQAQAIQGQVDPRAIINANDLQIDAQGTATGVNADGSINYTGQALNDYATLDLNDIDTRATTKGQLDILQSEFTDPNTGLPRIPAWAAGTARSVSRIASFRGMSGTASTAAMAQALMEASLPIAQQDAQFFQTVTLQNLNNKQASIINKANVLAKMDLANLDARTAAAVQNSKNFMDMDLKNLDNAQQAEIINTQARVQSILEDAKEVNAARLFTAEQQNDMAKFYDQLNSQIDQFNTSQLNNMAQFNAGEINTNNRFNADLANQREEFYKNMQYNIDLANAKWRQTVTLTNSQQKFDAAATDVKNMVGLSQEMLNRLWDRSDALLDYVWKSSENEKDRKATLTALQLKGDIDSKNADREGLGSILGSIAGSIAGSKQFLDFLF